MRLEARCAVLNCPVLGPCPSCAPGLQCQVVSQTCSACATYTCAPSATAAPSSGVSKGALAGAVIGIVVFLAGVLAGVWFLHKRNKARRALEQRALEPKADVPASAADVLSRPDPVEKPKSPAPNRVGAFSNLSDHSGHIEPTSSAGHSSHASSSRQGVEEGQIHNPFADQLSIGTESTQSQGNVIPIAIVPYGTVNSPGIRQPEANRGITSPTPSRPLRSPDINLRMDADATPPRTPGSYNLQHINVSDDNVTHARNGVAPSMRSDITGMSAGSHASYMSTGTYATDLFTESPTIVTRQQGKILGLSKAQVVEVPSSLSNAGSPLPSSHLTPSISRLSRMTTARSMRSPLAQSSFTPADIIEMDEQVETSPFADNNARRVESLRSDLRSTRTVDTYASHEGPWGNDDTDSIASGIEASITSAKRVVVGNNGQIHSTASSAAMSPTSSRNPRFSFLSEASSRADSILEAFPFVPPSPHTPTSHRSFGSLQSTKPTDSKAVEPPSSPGSDLQAPDRRLLGLSTFSQGSAASSGLEAFPFELQLDSAAESQTGLPKRTTRASLDTLALSRDLTAFPLAYDEESERSPPNKYASPSRKSSNTRAHT